ncbi:MAG: ribosome-associated translation inhibitor RaiA [Actinobacteria bacterium]|nr:ribosome-associated translation inhibitor RaiA [Actinomycetota bacterium]
MEVRVHGRHNKPSMPVRRFAEEKLGHLGKYLRTIASIDVQLFEDGKPRDGGNRVAQVTVRTSGPVFRSKATSGTYRASIDIAYERLERRIKEFKRKRSGKPPHHDSPKLPT